MKIIKREQWGARLPRAVTQLPLAKVDTIVIHYSSAFSDETGPFAARIRGIQNYHMDTQKWSDIAYNFLVARDGTIYEGRGFGIQSAATLNNNDHTLAICFLGADKVGRDDVTDKGRKAIASLIAETDKRAARKLKVKGHKDFVSTECPGDELYHYVVTRGYEQNKPVPLPPEPKWFWTWVAWRLGEGKFKDHGKANAAVRPKNVPANIPAVAWLGFRIFLANRKLS